MVSDIAYLWLAKTTYRIKNMFYFSCFFVLDRHRTHWCMEGLVDGECQEEQEHWDHLHVKAVLFSVVWSCSPMVGSPMTPQTQSSTLKPKDLLLSRLQEWPLTCRSSLPFLSNELATTMMRTCTMSWVYADTLLWTPGNPIQNLKQSPAPPSKVKGGQESQH